MMRLTSQEELEKILKRFRNSKDLDIQRFLNENAIIYEKRRWCSTYIVVNEESFAFQQDFHIEGYFTLSNKVISLGDEVSNTLRKKLANGLARKDNHIHTILIGQLGKYIDEDAGCVSNLSAKQLLDIAFKLISEATERIAARVVIVECKQCLETDTETMFEKRQKLHEIYTNYGFKVLQNRGDLTQYFKII